LGIGIWDLGFSEPKKSQIRNPKSQIDMVGVRRATKNDAAIVAGFAMKLVEQHYEYDPDRFARIASLDGMKWFYGEQTDAKDAAVLVAELDGKVVGFAYVTYVQTDYLDLAVFAAQLQDIYVDEGTRHSGAGKALIDASINVAKEFGASKVILSVADRNQVARDFFERSGFRPTMTEMTLNLS
jgi:ribosomal protein S18 acetylase RimI-like enzyme